MANFFVSYDLNGPRPSHKEMDDHLAKIGTKRGRVLETVWYVDYPGSTLQLRNHIASILGSEDLLLVIESNNAAWTSLLVDTIALQQAWRNVA